MSMPECQRPLSLPNGDVTVPWAGHTKESCRASSVCAEARMASASVVRQATRLANSSASCWTFARPMCGKSGAYDAGGHLASDGADERFTAAAGREQRLDPVE